MRLSGAAGVAAADGDPRAAFPARDRLLLVACAAAGFLAVPLHAAASPMSALIAGLAGVLGLRVWQWSRVPSSRIPQARGGIKGLIQPAVWLGVGLIVGLLLLGVIRLAIEPGLPAAGARIAAAGAMPLWRRLLIIYVAAVGEEVIFRLLLLSLVAGLAVRLFRGADALPNLKILWMASGLSALAFSAVHLPAWGAAGPLRAALAFIIVALNALGGLVFGYAFVKRGIGAAMCAHAGADCAMLLIGPLTG